MARATKTHDGEEEKSAALTRPRWRSAATAPPFSLMRSMVEDMDRMFGGTGFTRWNPALFERNLWPAARDIEQVWIPQIETLRRDDKIIIRADLPGMSRDDVNVEIEKGMLKISGERREEHEEERDEYYRTERSYGSFLRTIPLPEGVSEDQTKATFRDGVLEVSVPAPKQESQQHGRRIDIK